MSDGILDEVAAAGIADAACAQALAAERRTRAVAEIVAQARAAVAALVAEFGTLAAGVGVDHRWTGTALQLLLPGGAYGPAVDLVGGEGPAGPVPTFVIGDVRNGGAPALAFHPDPSRPNHYIVDAVFERGSDGANGYAAVLALVADGARRVLRVVDWTGGTGARPAVGAYVGPAGLVATAAEAADVRGPPGAGDFNGPGASLDGELPLLSGTAGNRAKRSGVVPSAFGLGRLADADGPAALAGLGAAPLASPAFTGAPSAPSPAAGDSSTRLATTAFVVGLYQQLVGMAPAELDTLREIADRLLANESSDAALVAVVAGKLAKAQNLADLPDKALARTALQLGAVALLNAISIGDVTGLQAALNGKQATLAKASQAQAQVGTDDATFMTPARTADAVSALARQIGDYLTTARPPGASYLRRDGAFYASVSYPVLAALIPYASKLTFAQAMTQNVGGFNAVAYSPSLDVTVAVGNGGAIYTRTGANGAWTQRASGTTADLLSIQWLPSFNGGSFAACGTGGALVLSTDGAAWTARASGVTTTLRAVGERMNNGIVVAGDGGVIRYTTATTGDLSGWTNPSTARLYAATFIGSAFVFVGAGGTILATSFNSYGATLTQQASGTTADLYGTRVFGSPLGGLLAYAYGAGGALTTSPDGQVWTPRPTGSAANLRAGTFIDGAVRLLGDGGVVLTSKDLVYFLSQGSGLNANFTAFTPIGSAGVAVTSNGASPGVGTVQVIGTAANDQFQVPSDDAARGYIKALAA